MSDGLAIQVDHAYKRYSDNWVLKGLNMAVHQGSIYALLGPSGCGKSTLLNCIVGQMSLHSGSIAINCERRNQLGYMPQSIALYLTMTIGETFSYYGTMGNMNKEEIKERSDKLSKLLELPPLNRVIDTLSGGQQRRMSLSVALINDPSLLLLDEPTVGLDPVLSHNIWNHLVKLAKDEKKAIVITTHYIEEARQANTVGLMRGGVLLCEETPENLLKNNNCDTMEQVFLKLSRKQEDILTSNNNNYIEPNKDNDKMLISDSRSKLKRGQLFSIPYCRAEVKKNVIFIWRNKPMLMLLLLLPLMVAYVFHYALGPDPRGVHLAIVNKEVNSLAECFSQTFVGCNESQPLSCRVLQRLAQKNYILLDYKSWKEGVEAVRHRADVWGVIEVPKNYTVNVVERFTENLHTPDDVIDKGEMNVWLDNSNYFIGKYIEIYISQSFFDGVGSFFNDCGWPSGTFKIPINFQEPIFGLNPPNMRHYTSPPLLILIIFYLPMAYTIGVLIQEKLSGVLERSMVAGLTLGEVLIGHIAVQLIVLFGQCLIIMVTVFWWHQHPMLGSIFWTTMLLLLQGISGLSFGFLTAVSVDSLTAGAYTSLGTLIAYFFLSGSLWPQEGIYPLLRMMRPLIPLGYSVEAFRSLTARGWPVTHPIVVQGFVSVICWTICVMVLALFIEYIKRYFAKK